MPRISPIRIAKLTGLAVALVMMLCAIWAGLQQTDVRAMFTRPEPLLIGIVLYALYCVLNANAWLLILKSLGCHIPATVGIPLWIRCESLRWLPGNIWNFGARAVEANQLGVSSATGAISMTSELGFSVLSRVLLAGCGGFVFATQLRAQLPDVGVIAGVGCVAACLIAATLFVARSKHAVIQSHWANVCSLATLVFDRKRLSHHGALLLYYLAIGCLHGLALKCLVVSLTGNHDVSLFALISANAAAWLVGFFALFAPGGLVVREAALATALSAWFSTGECLSIAISWRVVQTIVEFVLLACVLWWGRKRSDVDRFDAWHVLSQWMLRFQRNGAS